VDVPNLFLGTDAIFCAAPAFSPCWGRLFEAASRDQDIYRPPNRAQIATTAAISSMAKIVRRPMRFTVSTPF
jgi:hypothetical protein